MLSSIIVFLSTKGYETSKFNQIISSNIQKFDKNISLELKKIKIKLDIKNFNLFLGSKDPSISYQKTLLPISDVKIFVNFFSLFGKQIKIDSAVLEFDKIFINDLRKIILISKPSNFKSFAMKNISKGSIKGKLKLNFLENDNFDYQFNGNINDAEFNILKKYNFKNVNFKLIADNENILVNKILFNLNNIPVKKGFISIEREKGFSIDGSLTSEINLNLDEFKKISNSFTNFRMSEQIENLNFSGSLIKKFNLSIDETLKIKNYKINLKSDFDNSLISLKEPNEIVFFKDQIKDIIFSKSIIEINKSNETPTNVLIQGLYKLKNNSDFKNFKIINNYEKKKKEFDINIELVDPILIDFINYEKKAEKIANVNINFLINKNEKLLKDFIYEESKSKILIKNLKLDKKNKLKELSSIKVNTFKDDIENNNFEIKFKKKIEIYGNKFDSTNLIKNLNKISNTSNPLSNISKDINISFKEILTKLSKPLNDFNLIGKIEKGKFVKISSKSEFNKDQFLDIALKKDPSKNKKILEIYSDLPKPLLSDIKFFTGIKGGQLLYTSTYDDYESNSNLKLKNFKVLNAPAFAKLLALADLRGLEVLLSGQGLDFESLEIKLNENKKVRKVEEIYAVGPSITVLMDGYIEKETGLTSLRGTMVPAKEINKLISKIPVLGEILIGKEVGEGVFGVSFKMKGLPGKIKTTVNPIKSLTPRFITRALEKRKKNKEN